MDVLWCAEDDEWRGEGWGEMAIVEDDEGCGWSVSDITYPAPHSHYSFDAATGTVLTGSFSTIAWCLIQSQRTSKR